MKNEKGKEKMRVKEKVKREKGKEWGCLQREKARGGMRGEAGAGGPARVVRPVGDQGTGHVGGGLGSLWVGQSGGSQEWVGFAFGTLTCPACAPSPS